MVETVMLLSSVLHSVPLLIVGRYYMDTELDALPKELTELLVVNNSLITMS